MHDYFFESSLARTDGSQEAVSPLKTYGPPVILFIIFTAILFTVSVLGAAGQ
jgi:hypothetical protein